MTVEYQWRFLPRFISTYSSGCRMAISASLAFSSSFLLLFLNSYSPTARKYSATPMAYFSTSVTCSASVLLSNDMRVFPVSLTASYKSFYWKLGYFRMVLRKDDSGESFLRGRFNNNCRMFGRVCWQILGLIQGQKRRYVCLESETEQQPCQVVEVVVSVIYPFFLSDEFQEESLDQVNGDLVEDECAGSLAQRGGTLGVIIRGQGVEDGQEWCLHEAVNAGLDQIGLFGVQQFPAVSQNWQECFGLVGGQISCGKDVSQQQKSLNDCGVTLIFHFFCLHILQDLIPLVIHLLSSLLPVRMQMLYLFPQHSFSPFQQTTRREHVSINKPLRQLEMGLLEQYSEEGDSAESDTGAAWLSHPEECLLDQTSDLACVDPLGHFDDELVSGMGALSAYLVGPRSHQTQQQQLSVCFELCWFAVVDELSQQLQNRILSCAFQVAKVETKFFLQSLTIVYSSLLPFSPIIRFHAGLKDTSWSQVHSQYADSQVSEIFIA